MQDNFWFSIQRECKEYEHFEKTEGNEEQLEMEPLGNDEELKVDDKCLVCPPLVQPLEFQIIWNWL